jgi:hypothetical protein
LIARCFQQYQIHSSPNPFSLIIGYFEQSPESENLALSLLLDQSYDDFGNLAAIHPMDRLVRITQAGR